MNPREDEEASEPITMAELMSLRPDGDLVWTADEMRAIYRRQMETPLDSSPDIGGLGRWESSGEEPPIRTYRDLFEHPNPPVDLLKRVKDAAKAARHAKEPPIPREAAGALYLAAIAAGLTRCNERITELTDASLVRSLHRVLEAPWLDLSTRTLLVDAMTTLTGD